MWLTRLSWCKIAHKWKFALRRSMNIDKSCCTLNSVIAMQTLSGYLFREWLLRVYIAPYHSIPCCICYEDTASIVGRHVRHIRWTMTYYISHEDTLTPAATPLTFVSYFSSDLDDFIISSLTTGKNAATLHIQMHFIEINVCPWDEIDKKSALV